MALPSIIVAERTWPVRIVRHATARHYRLRLDPVQQELRLTLPLRADAAHALDWAAQQGGWLAAQVRLTPGPKPIGDGVIFPYRGQDTRIRWERHAPHRILNEDEVCETGVLIIGGGLLEEIGRRVEHWLRVTALRLLSEESRAMAAAVGLQLGRVAVGDPRSRWGSCSSKGNLRYSWRLILAPDEVRRATVAHEVAHLRHMHHGPEFHKLVDKIHGSDVSLVRHWLRAHGHTLHLYRFDNSTGSTIAPPDRSPTKPTCQSSPDK